MGQKKWHSYLIKETKSYMKKGKVANMSNNGFDLNGYHDSHCEGPYCNCDSRRYGHSSGGGSGVVAFICIALAFVALLAFPPLGFIIFWGWVLCSK